VCELYELDGWEGGEEVVVFDVRFMVAYMDDGFSCIW
jgi:hypothetical protein